MNLTASVIFRMQILKTKYIKLINYYGLFWITHLAV